eukprot:4883954-Prymnesium_polylepis.1
MRPPTPGCGAFWAVLALVCVVRSSVTHAVSVYVLAIYVGARFGTCLSCPPGMTWSSGSDCSAPARPAPGCPPPRSTGERYS